MTTSAGRSVWSVSESDHPVEGTTAERLRHLLQYAILAPSSHNAQPWRFRVEEDRVLLFADTARRLRLADPQDRELTIGCGAALFHLVVALRHFGLAGEVTPLPDPVEPALLAELRVVGRVLPTAMDDALFGAVALRRTYRLPFEERPVPAGLAAELAGAASAEGAWLRGVGAGSERRAVARLIAEGDRALFSHRPFRGDTGIARLEPTLADAVDLGPVQAVRNRRLAMRAPILAVIGTAADSARDWLRAGTALARVLLLARVRGATGSYLNQPVQVPSLRRRLREELALPGPPQLVLRLGIGKDLPPAPRRPVEEVLMR